MCLWQNAITAEIEENTIKVLRLPGCSYHDENLRISFSANSAVIAFCQSSVRLGSLFVGIGTGTRIEAIPAGIGIWIDAKSCHLLYIH